MRFFLRYRKTIILLAPLPLLHFPVSCATVDHADEKPHSKVVSYAYAGRFDEALGIIGEKRSSPTNRLKSIVSDFSLELDELYAFARIALYTRDLKVAETIIQNANGLLAEIEPTEDTPDWERRDLWRIVRIEHQLLAENSRMSLEDEEWLRKLASQKSYSSREPFESLRLLEKNACYSGDLGKRHDYVLRLLEAGEWLDGMGAEGAQAFEIASRFYSEVGDITRAMGFAPQAFRSQKYAGGMKNYYAARSIVVGAESLLDSMIEQRREGMSGAGQTEVALEELDQMLSNVSKVAAQLEHIDPALLLRIEMLKLEKGMLAEFPWIRRLMMSIVDAPQETERENSRDQLFMLAKRARDLNLPMLEAKCLRHISFSYKQSRNDEEAVKYARKALAKVISKRKKTDFKVLEYMNQLLLTLSILGDEKIECERIANDIFYNIESNMDAYFEGSTFIEKLNFSTSHAIQWGVSIVLGTEVLDIESEYDHLLRIKNRAHFSNKKEFEYLRSGSLASKELYEKLTRDPVLLTRFVFDRDYGSHQVGIHDREQRPFYAFHWKRMADLTTNWRMLSAETAANEGLFYESDFDLLGTIKSNLIDGEVVVDFVRVDIPELMDQVFAYIYGKDGKPIKIAVGETSWLGDLAGICRNGLADSDSISGKESFDESSEFFSRHLWGSISLAIEKADSDAKMVYIVPTREISAVPFSGLRSTGRYLIEYFSIANLYTALDLIDRGSDTLQANESVLVVGGMEYEKEGGGFWQSIRSSRADERFAASLTLSDLGKEEAEDVYQSYREKLGDASAKALLGPDASESTFRERIGEARVLHLQTHGFIVNVTDLDFYIPKNSPSKANGKTISSDCEIPMLLKYGLGFSGVNGRGYRDRDEGDGILSGLEISSLDLSNIDLVVLPACDAAIGEFFANEVMLGIAPSFAYAGVDMVVGSVSKVNDAASRRLMVLFHEEMLKGKTPAESMKDAVESFRQLSIGEHSLDRPAYWAPFVVWGPQDPLFRQAN